MPVILGIMGRRRCGKTESAKMLYEMGLEYGIEAKRLSFASVLKDMFAESRGISVEVLSRDFAKEQYREDIQKYGDLILSADPKYFVKELFKQVKPTDYAYIDDLRKIEELQAVLEAGGTPILIYADRNTRSKRGAVYDPITDNHISETELGDLSQETLLTLGGYYVYNNKTPEDLRYQLQGILKKVILPKL